MDDFVRRRVKQRRLEEKRVDPAVVQSFLGPTLVTSFSAICSSEVETKDGESTGCVFRDFRRDRDDAYRYPEVSQMGSELSRALHKGHTSCQASSGVMGNSLYGCMNHAPCKLPVLLRDTVLCSHDCSGSNAPFSALVLDIETTGLSPNIDQIIELGCVELRWNGCSVCIKDSISESSLTGHWVRGSRTFHCLVRPTISVTRSAAAVHSLSDESLRTASCWREVSKEFKMFCDSLQTLSAGVPNVSAAHEKADHDATQDTFILPPLIAHNAQFDGAFVENSLKRLGYRVLWHPLYAITCTERLARQLYPQHAANLDRVSAYLGVSGVAERMQAPHSAYRDAIQCAKVFLRLAQNISANRCEKPMKSEY